MCFIIMCPAQVVDRKNKYTCHLLSHNYTKIIPIVLPGTVAKQYAISCKNKTNDHVTSKKI